MHSDFSYTVFVYVYIILMAPIGAYREYKGIITTNEQQLGAVHYHNFIKIWNKK